MHWGAEQVDENVAGILLDSSWLIDDQERLDQLAHHIGRYSGSMPDLIERVRHHETFGLFVRSATAMSACGHQDLSARLGLPALQAEWARNREWLDHYYAELTEILAAASEVGIQPIVLKGAAWEHSIYHGSRTRSFGDLDLYVDTSEMEAFGAVLAKLGYQQSTYDPSTATLVPVSAARNRAALESGRHATPFVKRASIQLRHLIVEPHGPRNDENFHKIDTSAFMGRSVELDLGDVRARQLAAVDSLIYACAHIRKNLYVYPPVGRVAFPQLRWYCDIRQMFLAQRDDRVWESLYESAATLDRADAVHQALVYTDMLFPGTVPKGLLRPPDCLTRPAKEVIDDVWDFRVGSSRFKQRLFEPHVDEARYLRARATGTVGGRLSIPRVDNEVGAGRSPKDWPWPRARQQVLSGIVTPAWQYFLTHVSFGATPASDTEFSAVFQVLATASDLAIRVRVRDQQLYFGQSSGYYHGQDCVQLLFETPLGSRNISNVLLVPLAADLPGPTALFHYSGNDKAGTEPLDTSQTIANIDEDGYTIFSVIPMQVLGLSASAPFGFDVCVYESGKPGDERRSVLQWSGGRNNLRNPSFFGIAEIE